MLIDLNICAFLAGNEKKKKMKLQKLDKDMTKQRGILFNQSQTTKITKTTENEDDQMMKWTHFRFNKIHFVWLLTVDIIL